MSPDFNHITRAGTGSHAPSTILEASLNFFTKKMYLLGVETSLTALFGHQSSGRLHIFPTLQQGNLMIVSVRSSFDSRHSLYFLPKLMR